MIYHVRTLRRIGVDVTGLIGPASTAQCPTLSAYTDDQHVAATRSGLVVDRADPNVTAEIGSHQPTEDEDAYGVL